MGNALYRDFDIHSWLWPQFLELEVHLKGENNETLKSISYNDIEWKNDSMWVSLPEFRIRNARNGNGEIAAFEVRRMAFRYADNYLEEINRLSLALSSYYDAASRLETAYALIDGLSPDNPETAVLEEFKLCEAEIIAGKIRYAPFHGLIDNLGYDPLMIKPGGESLLNDLKVFRESFNYTLAHIDSLLFIRAENYQLRGELSKARELYGRVLAYNAWHVPSIIRLASMEMNTNQQQQAMQRLTAIMGINPPPGQWREQAVEFTSLVFESEIERATEIMKDGRYLDALRVLENLEDFCNKLHVWGCPAQLYESITQVHYGMYRSWLLVARRAYVSGNYSFSVSYVESAMEYQQKNREYVTDDAEARSLLQNVVQAYLFTASEALLINDFSGAIRHMEAAGELCKRYSYLNCPADLAQRLDETREQKETAERITLEYVLSEPRVVWLPRSEQEIRNSVLDNLSLGHLRAWAGNTDEARDLLNDIMESTMRYDLRNDSVINMRIVSLSDMIHKKECELSEREIQHLIQQVRDNVHRSWYAEARDKLQEAYALQENADKCAWDLGKSLDSLAFVDDLATYRELLSDAQAAYFIGAQQGFDIFLTKYTKVHEFYIQKELHRWDDQHNTPLDFVVNSDNPTLMKAAVSFFAQEKLPEQALRVLEELRIKRLDAREVRDLQETAGRQAAEYYFRQNSASQPAELARQLTGNDTWYRFYVRSFVNQWGNQD